MNYQEALTFIHGTEKFGSILGLERVHELLDRLGNPQQHFKVIHVAGTNGKGSVSAMLTNVLMAQGYKVGMFISPYLERFTERIQVNLREIPEEDLGRITGLVKDKVEEMVQQGMQHPTEFELVTAIGFYYFAECHIDTAVVEVGLGGRFDATNVVDPVLSVITSISYDHMNILGDTLSQIAFEKAGIIKPGRPVVSYPQVEEAAEVLRRASRERNSPYYEVSPDQITVQMSSFEEQRFDLKLRDRQYRNLSLKLPGRHQILNAATAAAALDLLGQLGFDISPSSILRGLENTKWPGRLEQVRSSPRVILDGAHNVSGAQSLANAVKEYFPTEQKIMIMGILRDKEVDGVIEELAPLADRIIVTRPENPRAMDPLELAERVKPYCEKTVPVDSIEDALKMGLQSAQEKDIILVSGSLYLIGRARKFLKT